MCNNRLYKITEQAVRNFKRAYAYKYDERDFLLVKKGMQLMAEAHRVFLEEVCSEEHKLFTRYKRYKRYKLKLKIIKMFKKLHLEILFK